MEKPSRSLLISVAIALALGVSANLVAWLEPACSNDSRRIIMKAAGGVGCFEFWLNRYQSLIGSVLTAGVAGITLLWLAKQLVAAHRQVAAADRQAAAAAAAALRGSLPDFDADTEALGKVGVIIGAAKKILEVPRPPDVFLSEFAFAVQRADQVVTKLPESFVPIAAIQSRATTPDVLQAVMVLQTIVRQVLIDAEPIITAGHGWNEGKAMPEDLDVEAAFLKLSKLLDQGIDGVNLGLTAVWKARDLTWQRIRAAELAATSF